MSNEIWTYAIIGISALIAGVMNSLAGGGTLLTFPALLTVLNPIQANATSTVALLPGSLAGVWGYKHEMRHSRDWALLLLIPSLIGGLIGSLLVTRLDPKFFEAVVPWLILLASILFLAQPTITRLAGIGKEHAPPSTIAKLGVIIFQFFVAVYGGYFGAGIGILMLSALGLMGMSDIHRMNAVKTFLAVCINGVSVAIFIAEHVVVWHYALIMAAAAILGGYLGARSARRMNRTIVRWIVILIGFGLAGIMFWKQWRT
jgi:uncharacterized membrane protein YfcA